MLVGVVFLVASQLFVADVCAVVASTLLASAAEVVKLRNEGLSWSQIAARAGVSIGTARRAYQDLTTEPIS